MLHFDYGHEIIALNSIRTEPLNTFFRGATRLGEYYAFVGLTLIALFFRFRYALLLAAAGLITLPLVGYLKDMVGSERPGWYFELTGQLDQVVFVPDTYMNTGYTSFPSGHTMAAFALYSLIALMTGRKIPILGVLCAWTAILVGISRIFLVQHFMLDVLGGMAFGLLLSDFLWQFDRRFLWRYRWLDKKISL
jgi:membrane-associated phospholipid phosphatase